MRMKILKVVVVLLLSGSGDARPQRTEESLPAQPSKVHQQEWRISSGLQTVREDSRYTWNSGSSTIPYVHYNRDSIDPFAKSVSEVSVDGTREPKSMASTIQHFWNSSPLRSEKSIANLNRQISTNPREQSTKTKNFTNPPVKRSDHRYSSSYSRVPSMNSRISNFGRPAKIPFKDSGRDNPSRRTSGGIPMNNSQVAVVALDRRNSELSDRKEGLSFASAEASSKVESTTSFDHVAAIKRITSMLTHRQNSSELSAESKHNVDANRPLITPPQTHSNRHSNSKHSNRTKIRRPQGSHSNKKNQAKVNPSKIHPTRNNSSKPNSSLKNWPNGVIQNADDYHNYDKYTSIDDLKPEETIEKPVPLKNSIFHYPAPISSLHENPSLQEIVHWLKIPAFMTNGSHVIESDQVDGPISVAFDPVYQNLEPNKPSKIGSLQNLKPGFIYPMQIPSYGTQNVPNWPGNTPGRNKTQKPVIHNPQTQVSQNTVVHLINTDLKKPNGTNVGSKPPASYVKPIVSASYGPSGSSGSSAGSIESSASSSPSVTSSGPGAYPSSLILSQLVPSSSATSKPGPNVHIGFTSYEEGNKVSEQQGPQTPVVTYDQSCPTILINTYTRINNTIQSKDGCTDLNIIINSHVFNTNTYKSTPPPSVSNSGNYQTYGEADKYGSQTGGSSNYQPIPIYQASSGSSQWPPQGYYDPPKGPQSQTLQQNDVSNVEVIQDTQISISSGESSPPVELSLAENPESGSANDSPSLGDVSNDGPGSSAVAGAPADQVNDSPGTNSLVRPAAAPATSNPASSVSSPTPPGGLATGAPAGIDDDDDDDFDMSPSGIMDSITSVFTYFTFVNPLHYGFFSLAAAPFTALAAGVLGIVTFLYPWLFPSSFGFSRAYNSAGDNFWSNLEEIVRQSMQKHGRVNEWKSKRKKRKR